jgi:hypothetical protein
MNLDASIRLEGEAAIRFIEFQMYWALPVLPYIVVVVDPYTGRPEVLRGRYNRPSGKIKGVSKPRDRLYRTRPCGLVYSALLSVGSAEFNV